MFGFTPNRGQVAAGNCCGVMCQALLMLKKRIQRTRDRDLESVRTLSERKDLHVYLEQKAGLAVRQNAQLRDDYLKLKRAWKQENGTNVVLIWLFVKAI